MPRNLVFPFPCLRRSNSSALAIFRSCPRVRVETNHLADTRVRPSGRTVYAITKGFDQEKLSRWEAGWPSHRALRYSCTFGPRHRYLILHGCHRYLLHALLNDLPAGNLRIRWRANAWISFISVFVEDVRGANLLAATFGRARGQP